MRCDVIAKGVIDAADILDLKIPIVVRLQGNLTKIQIMDILKISTSVACLHFRMSYWV